MRQDGGGGSGRGPAITVSEAAAGAPGAKMIRRAEGAGGAAAKRTDGRTRLHLTRQIAIANISRTQYYSAEGSKDGGREEVSKSRSTS